MSWRTVNRNRRAALWLTLLVLMGACGQVALEAWFTARVVPDVAVESNPEPALVDELVVIDIDGLRRDLAFDADYMPFVALLRAQGAGGRATATPVTMSGVGMRTISSGVSPTLVDTIRNWNMPAVEFDNFFQQAARHNKSIAILGDAGMTQCYGHYADYTLSIRDRGIKDWNISDDEVYSVGMPLLLGDAYNVTYLSFVGQDHVGHYKTPLSDEYRVKARWMDRIVRQAARDLEPGQALLLTSDHGQTDAGFHGSPEPPARDSPYVLWAPPTTRTVALGNFSGETDLAAAAGAAGIAWFDVAGLRLAGDGALALTGAAGNVAGGVGTLSLDAVALWEAGEGLTLVGDNVSVTLEIIDSRVIVPGLAHDMRQLDLAATMAVLMGFDIPAPSEGRLPVEIFDIAPQARANLSLHNQRQRLAYLRAYDDEYGLPRISTAHHAASEAAYAAGDWNGTIAAGDAFLEHLTDVQTRGRVQTRYHPPLWAAALGLGLLSACVSLRRTDERWRGLTVFAPAPAAVLAGMGLFIGTTAALGPVSSGAVLGLAWLALGAALTANVLLPEVARRRARDPAYRFPPTQTWLVAGVALAVLLYLRFVFVWLYSLSFLALTLIGLAALTALGAGLWHFQRRGAPDSWWGAALLIAVYATLPLLYLRELMLLWPLCAAGAVYWALRRRRTAPLAALPGLGLLLAGFLDGTMYSILPEITEHLRGLAGLGLAALVGANVWLGSRSRAALARWRAGRARGDDWPLITGWMAANAAALYHIVPESWATVAGWNLLVLMALAAFAVVAVQALRVPAREPLLAAALALLMVLSKPVEAAMLPPLLYAVAPVLRELPAQRWWPRHPAPATIALALTVMAFHLIQFSLWGNGYSISRIDVRVGFIGRDDPSINFAYSTLLIVVYYLLPWLLLLLLLPASRLRAVGPVMALLVAARYGFIFAAFNLGFVEFWLIYRMVAEFIFYAFFVLLILTSWGLARRDGSLRPHAGTGPPRSTRGTGPLRRE